MGLQDDEEDEGNGKRYIGRTVNKFFQGYGYFRGEVISFNKTRKFFKVKYADGDREELDLAELKAILVDDAPKDSLVPESKGSTGRKRKRDQPVKNAKGSPFKSEENVHGADVVASKVQLFAENRSENTGPVVKPEVSGIGFALHQAPGQVTPVVSDQSKVDGAPSSNGVLQMDVKLDSYVDGRGTKRMGDLLACVEENHLAPQKKRARDASSSDFSGLEGSNALPNGEQHLGQGTSIIASQEVKAVIKASLDTVFSASRPPLPLPAGSALKVSQAGCSQTSAGAQLVNQSGSDQTSLSISEVTTTPQQLSARGTRNWAAAQPSPSSFVTPDTKSSLPTEKQVEPVAKDVFSLRALRAISRSLPVQRQVIKSTPVEESESTIVDANPEPIVEPEAIVPLKLPLPPSSTCLGDLEHCVADLLQAYSFLRSFSQILFISPFALEEFVVALSSEVVSPMVDCIHVSLLHALRRHLERLAKGGNNSAVFCLRLSDWSLLDNITWPSYLVAYALTQGFLSGCGRSSEVCLVKKNYYKLAIDKKLAFLNFLCDKAVDTDELRTEIARRIAFENESDMFDPRGCSSKHPDGSRRDIISLEGEFDEEFERMTRQKREAVAHKSGMQLLVQGKSLQAGEIKQPERGEDGNLDECALCGMDGVLICCDGCPAAYHSRCVGITKQGLPPGDWFCPECRADKQDSKGLKISKGVRGGELLFIGPDGQRFFSTCGYLLVSEPNLETDSAHRYYSPKDIPVFLKHLEAAGRVYAPLREAILPLCQADLDSATTATVSPAKTDVAFIPQCNEVKALDAPSSAGYLPIISGIVPGPDPTALKTDAPVTQHLPASFPSKQEVHKEVFGSEGSAAVSQVVAERSLASVVGTPADLGKVEGRGGTPVGTGATNSGIDSVQQTSSQLKTDASGPPVDVVSPERVVHTIQHNDEPVRLGNLTVVGPQMNGKMWADFDQPSNVFIPEGVESHSHESVLPGNLKPVEPEPEANEKAWSACAQPVSGVTPEGVENNLQQNDNRVVPGNMTPIGPHVNGNVWAECDKSANDITPEGDEQNLENKGEPVVPGDLPPVGPHGKLASACDQPASAITPEGVVNLQQKYEQVVFGNLTPVGPQLNGNVSAACDLPANVVTSERVEPNLQPKDEPVVPENLTRMGPQVNGKAWSECDQPANVVTSEGDEHIIQQKDEPGVPGHLNPLEPEMNGKVGSACDQPANVVTLEGAEHNIQQKDEPGVPGHLDPLEPETNGKVGSACDQPANVVTLEGVEHNIQQKDELVAPGNVNTVGPQINGKVVSRQLDGNFSSLTQINASSYVNKYINGDIVFTAATYLAAMAGNPDDAPDDKAGSQKKIKPLSAADQLKAFSQAAPNFFWPSLKKKVLDAPKEKCGWCINCRTTNRKGCLLTQVTGQISGGAAGASGGIKPVKGAGGHYAAVAGYMLYMEEQLQGLLVGPWEGVGYRKLWRKRVEQGRSIQDVRRALLEMESSLRKITLTSDWEKVLEDAPPLVSEYVISFVGPGASSSKKAAPKRRGRPPLVSKSPPVFAYDGACFGLKWFRGGPLSRQVYSWESIPRKTLRKAARQGGLKEIRDLICTKTTDLPRKTLQCAWRARTEKVSAVAQLALQVRCLDKYIKWSELRLPVEESSQLTGKALEEKKLSEAEIVSKTEEDGVVKYLLSFPKDPADSNDSTHQESDVPTKTPIISNAIGAGTEGGNEQWYLEKDLPLCLVKNFEQKRRKTEQTKLQKSVKGRKGQVTVVQKEPSFWDKIINPEVHTQKTSGICGFCSLSCIGSESIQCHRCTENFHIGCTEIEETLDGRDKLAVCKNCAKQRLGQRNRKPSYKMRSMQSHHGEGSFAGTNNITSDGDGEDICGATPKSLAKRKARGPALAAQSTPVRENSVSGKRKTANRKNVRSDPSAEAEDEDRTGPAAASGSKSRRKSKNVKVQELQTSLDITPIERRTSSRIRNSMSPNKINSPVVQDQSSKVKGRPSSKRKMALRGDSSQAETDASEDEFEFDRLEKKKSPQKRKRLKVLLQGLPLTPEDTDNNHLQNDENHVTQKRKKASNGLQYVQRKSKTDADVARFRSEKLVFAGHVGIDPATGPRCTLCSEGYDPAFSFVCCEWCQAWYHGDAVGLTQEDASVLTGFKCHKCRKCRAPDCPVSSTRQRRSAAKGRRRGGVDNGEVIDADSANRNAQPSWRYPLDKDFIGFDDTKDFVAATNQAEQALAVDGSNFGHSLTGTVFELGGGLMTDLEHQIHLNTPLSSLGEHNVNLWASNGGSGQLDLSGGFSPPLDLAARGSASLSFTELLASEDDYLEGVPGAGLPVGAGWVGNQVVPGAGASSSTAWSGGAGVAEGEYGAAELGSLVSGETRGVSPSFSLPAGEAKVADLNVSSISAGTTGTVPDASLPGGEAGAPSTGVDPCANLPGSVPNGMSTVSDWSHTEASAAVTNAASWDGQMSDLLPTSLPPEHPSLGGFPSFPVVGMETASEFDGSFDGTQGRNDVM